jgi:hypothetical protein
LDFFGSGQQPDADPPLRRIVHKAMPERTTPFPIPVNGQVSTQVNGQVNGQVSGPGSPRG